MKWLKAIGEVVSYIQHIPGHKNSKGESAPWVIKDHKIHEILRSYKTEQEAKDGLKNMHIFSYMVKYRKRHRNEMD